MSERPAGRMVMERPAAWRESGLKRVWIAPLVIVLDQITKRLAADGLTLHEPVAVMPLVNLTLTHNAGAAFSLLSSATGWQRWFFIGLALAVGAVIVVWLRRMPAAHRLAAVALALVLGGALGNVWDRIHLGYVIDFIDLYYGRWHWPAFNIADSAITAGALLLVVDALSDARPRGL